MTTADPEAAYYQAIEEYFVSHRGDPLFLSNADWHLIRKWRQAGIPLRIVLRGIRDALDGHAHSWSRTRKVGSLAYCAQEVEVARERWERALSLGSEAGHDVTLVLAGFASSLEAARGLGPGGSGAARAMAAELRLKAGASLAEVEPWLVDRESRLVACLRAEMDAGRLAGLESQVDEALAPYRERMPVRVLDQIRQDSLTRRILEAHGLPRLSLFHLASSPSPGER